MIVDSLDGATARLEEEDGSILEVPRAWIPGDAREGSVLIVRPERDSAAATVCFSLDREGEELRRKTVRSKLDRLRSRSDTP